MRNIVGERFIAGIVLTWAERGQLIGTRVMAPCRPCGGLEPSQP
ncbi:hypothetical protein HMPREF9622_02780 [Cutibacterium modestum HL037PA3]|uniref:MOSC domain-containing protein n=1 Tax=Cutibacterium modestum HL044PA1 TaxID=765109 RepID=A0ABP2K7D2_9ACTN|nr:hypothetical protein HMPREF9621_02587 [Cutibacterium modestum HL037PA2]EFS92047.1 hypothetical protein HMPREF9607_01675 [Cutibacterium modestum HL044PA1]EFT14143.1 hypothetical protein HMPREF9622_02780 [Cutibacterium modestum HL037PA3]EGG25747.1 hypothetical protein PA08_2699 [Cutibacterium modestum P08]